MPVFGLPAGRALGPRHHGGDDGVDVLFDVDAGLLLELVAVLVVGLELAEPLAEARNS